MALVSCLQNKSDWMKKINNSGQAAAESLMAVILILGLLLVITLIAVQQRQQIEALETREEQATLCRELANTIEAANNLEGQSNIVVNIELKENEKIVVTPTNLSFEPSGYYCYFNAEIEGLQAEPYWQEINIDGEYTISKNSSNRIVIAPRCISLTCESLFVEGDSHKACGTYEDECGGEIFCINGCVCEDDCAEGDRIACPADCALCGNLICETGETRSSCPVDCELNCGNSVCEEIIGETRENCDIDCGCGNGICDSFEGEDFVSCIVDCHCGDNSIQFGTPYFEVCDCGIDGFCTALELNNQTCESQGFSTGGTLGCGEACTVFDTDNCSPCNNECTSGEKECLLSGSFYTGAELPEQERPNSFLGAYHVCVLNTGTGCWEWGRAKYCEQDEECSHGICIPSGAWLPEDPGLDSKLP